MEGLKPPDIVFSSAGHDKGKTFIVLETQGDKACLVDGKIRKLIKPKVKNLKHIRFGKAGSPTLAGAISQGTATDRLIRKELAIFRSETGDLEEGNQLVERRCD